MYLKLYNLWFIDHKARLRVYAAAIAIAFCYGVLNNVLLGRPEARVTWETLAVLCATLGLFTVWYCVRPERSTEGMRYRRIKRSLVFLGGAAVVAFSALAVLVVPESTTPASDAALTTIREQVQAAQSQGTVLPAPELASYKSIVRAIPPSSSDYWETLAAIVNYQSLLNQKNGSAPDPSEVARPCIAERYYGNVFADLPFQDCVIKLDNNIFRDVVFKDSVIYYNGGSVSLTGVTFVNCRFVLDLKAVPVTAPQKQLLHALFESPDQKKIEIAD